MRRVLVLVLFTTAILMLPQLTVSMGPIQLGGKVATVSAQTNGEGQRRSHGRSVGRLVAPVWSLLATSPLLLLF
jgi:hypothetical protein